MRKKFTMLFAALLACVGVMKAETETITDLSSVIENASYVIYTNEGGLIANQEGTNVTATPIANFDKSETVSQFAFIKQGDEYYLWSISAEKFLANDGRFVSTATPQAIEFVQLDGNWEGRVRMRFDGSHNINITNSRNSVVIDGWTSADEGTAYYVEVAKENVDLSAAVEMLSASVEVTYIYKYNGEEVARKTKTQDNNSAYSAPAIDYVTFAYPDENPVSETNKEVVVTCTENLPFEKSESFENAKWYIVDMHSNDNGTADIYNGSKKYVWTYNGEDYDKSNVQLPKEDSKQTSVFGDDKMWCFVGDVFNGFKIYNKAAGNALTLNKASDGNNKAGMSDAASATLYTLVPGKNMAGSACFLPKGHTYYLNTQKDGDVKILKGWNDNDGGSSCRFFAPTYFVKDLLDDCLMPAGVVTAPEALTDDMSAVIRTAYDAVAADGWNTAAITAEVTAALEAVKASEVITLSEGYYFIKGTGVGNDAAKYATYNSANKFQATNETLGAKHVWYFAAVDGGYSMKSCNLEKYAQLQNASEIGSGPSEFAAEAVKFTFTNSGDGKFIIKDADSHVMRSEGDGRINFWGSETNESWYLVPVTELEISINKFASICMPFDVEVEGATAYAVTATNENSATLTEKEDIPAGEGAILEGNGTAKLVLTTAKSNWDDNKLEGTYVNTYVEGAAYVLANGKNDVGLYKAALNKDANGAEGTTHFLNNANKAYLVVEGANAPMFSFNRGEGTTSIEDVELINDNVVIYDITGRRVEKMEKGIYIVNGKKVLVK